MDWYLPGYKAGGPVRTVANMVDRFAGEMEFLVVTRDRDQGDREPYPGLRVGEWNEVNGARVLYLPRRGLGPRYIARVCRDTPHDLVYLNSLFSKLTIGQLAARLLARVPERPVVLAPRGEFSPAALRIRSLRKSAYLALATRARLMDGILWQASAVHEKSDIERELGRRGALPRSRGVMVAPDLLAATSAPRIDGARKEPGRARFLFLSRVSPMKNLHTAVRLVGDLQGEVSLDVHGPVDDLAYWAECRRAMDTLPGNARARYLGPVRPDEVAATMGRYDFLILPTLGESFGHVIAESLAAGTPVVVSDRTPWGRVEARGAGWCIALEDERLWKRALQRCIDMDRDEHDRMSRAAHRVVAEEGVQEEAMAMNRRLFQVAAGVQPTA